MQDVPQMLLKIEYGYCKDGGLNAFEREIIFILFILRWK